MRSLGLQETACGIRISLNTQSLPIWCCAISITSDDIIKPLFNSLNVMYVNQFYALVWAWALTMDAACRLQSAKSKYVDKGPSL